jgi:hypothetical protein
MISKTRPAFWRCHAKLSSETRLRARSAYRLFLVNPHHPSLHFKKLAGYENVWSVRVSEQYRAVGVRSGDTIEWIWIGTHNEFDKLFA